MKAQTPAEGIMLHKDWGDSKMYTVACECGCDDGIQTIEVEVDELSIAVHIYNIQKTNWWTMSRWQHIWTLLTKGYIKTEGYTILTKQQALNYAETLKSAIKDIEKFGKVK